MLNFCSLYSGSTGNCLFVQSKDTKILVDAGVSTKKIEEALSSIFVSPNEISAIIVTHEHIDHVRGIGNFSKKYNVPVFANSETWNSIPNEQTAKVSIENISIFDINSKFNINDLEILPFSIPHDAANPCGFNIYNENSKISIATDLGHITPEIFKNLENSSFILLESNYEPEVLRYGKYPYMLKRRIDGPYGHLSNSLAGQTISKLIPLGLKYVMLGHLSKENNFPELAYQTVLEELKNNNYNENTIDLSIASRYSPSKLISIA